MTLTSAAGALTVTPSRLSLVTSACAWQAVVSFSDFTALETQTAASMSAVLIRLGLFSCAMARVESAASATAISGRMCLFLLYERDCSIYSTGYVEYKMQPLGKLNIVRTRWCPIQPMR